MLLDQAIGAFRQSMTRVLRYGKKPAVKGLGVLGRDQTSRGIFAFDEHNKIGHAGNQTVSPFEGKGVKGLLCKDL